MSVLLSSAKLATEALRNVGKVSPYDNTVDPESLEITLLRLDLLIAELVGTEEIHWFVPVDQQFALTVDETEYELNTKLSTPIQFVQHVFLVRNGREIELDQVRRSELDARVAAENPEEGFKVYVERDDDPMLYTFFTPIEGDILLIRGQKYASNLTANHGSVPHGFPTAWQRSIILQLAADIGSGPIVTLPDNELNRLEKKAGTAFRRLMSFNNRENVRKPRYTRPQEF